MTMWNSVTWLLACGLAASTSAHGAAAAPTPAQAEAAQSGALPWGPPVPRALQASALAHRQRVLAHCVRLRMNQARSVDEATQACLQSLPWPQPRPTHRWASRPMPDGTGVAQ
ncbi:hypothetical protein [Ideonella sp. A 288]|uniref:hypothetical protein n=1 Tax=Ideonella sp. A 288 TaxID=1962181 RepID=UPI000B4B37E0|nr:hypothetical protein [Ideonella sp. A 288]